MDYIQILFTAVNDDQKDVFIALLADIGFEGFEEEADTLKALIPQNEYDENLLNSVIYLNNLKYSKSIIKDKNWNEQWESDFEPISVYTPYTSRPFVYVRANFHEPNSLFEYDIEVTPKMSFGTGHHATTYLMLVYMSEVDFANKSVIDFGTGTGVLGIFAEKLGAENVLAIDNDVWSINNARENVAVNNCKRITVTYAETIPDGNKAEVILANINLNIIKANIKAIKNASSESTVFLFSGLMLHDEANIISILKEANILVKNVYKRENWLCILCTN